MDITRDREADTLIKSAIGDALRQLRQHKGLTLADAARITGKTPEKLSQIEDGQKVINLPHFFQLVATYGGKVVVKGDNLTIEIDGVKPFTPDQLRAIHGQQDTARRREEARRNLERMFGTSGTATPATGTTPRQSKNRHRQSSSQKTPPPTLPPQSKN